MARRSTVGRSVPGCSAALDEDREQADHDREDAEALGERGEDDRDAADLAGRIGIATDRLGRHAGEDADADARAEDPESGKTGADVLHVNLPPVPRADSGSIKPWSLRLAGASV